MGERGPLPRAKGRAAPGASARLPVPAAPEGLSEAVLGAWRAYWGSEVSGVAAEVDLPAIGRLFGLYAQHERAAAVVEQALVVKGSTGQVRVNPLAGHMLQLESAILRLENELGLTPAARARLGISIEEKHAAATSFIDELAKRRRAG